jgi:hypothetical protein
MDQNVNLCFDESWNVEQERSKCETQQLPCDPCVEDVRLLLLFVQALASSAATSTAATSFAASAHKLRCIWSWCCAG